MRLDRKLLLIAPAIVLALLFVGVAYTATQLHVLTADSGDWTVRNGFVTAVAHGTKPLTQRQAVEMLEYSLAAEAERTNAIASARDLLIVLTVIGFVACAVLVIGIRGVPRQHWPRFSRGDGPVS